MKSCKPKV